MMVLNLNKERFLGMLNRRVTEQVPSRPFIILVTILLYLRGHRLGIQSVTIPIHAMGGVIVD